MPKLDMLFDAFADRVRQQRPPKTRVASQRPFPPLSLAQVESAEARIGYRLPPLLRRSYLELGNGGFGPGFGLLTLSPVTPAIDQSIPTLYLRCREGRRQRGGQWKAGTVPLSSWGDMILSCIDLSETGDEFDPPVIRYEPNMPEAWTHAYLNGGVFRGGGLFPEGISLSGWLQDWLDGKEMFRRPYYTHGPIPSQPGNGG
jgi:hypothetical protein